MSLELLPIEHASVLPGTGIGSRLDTTTSPSDHSTNRLRRAAVALMGFLVLLGGVAAADVVAASDSNAPVISEVVEVVDPGDAEIGTAVSVER